MIANLSRALMALGRLKVAGIALAGSGLLELIAQVMLAELAPAHLVVGALALGNTVGATVAAIPLVIVTRRIRGKAAVREWAAPHWPGWRRVVGAAVGVATSVAIPVNHGCCTRWARLAAVCAVAAYGAVALLLDDGDLQVVLRAVRTRLPGRARLRAQPLAAESGHGVAPRADDTPETACRPEGQLPPAGLGSRAWSPAVRRAVRPGRIGDRVSHALGGRCHTSGRRLVVLITGAEPLAPRAARALWCRPA